MNLTWRSAVVAAACVAASTLVSADATTYLLGLPERNPAIEFGGVVNYLVDGSQTLNIAGNSMYSTLSGGEIVAVIVINGKSAVPPTVRADGSHACDPSDPSLFPARDTNGTWQCFQDAGWAPLQFTAGVVPPGAAVYATPPQFSVVPPSPDACGLANGDNLCIRGTVVRCLNPPPGSDIHACTGTSNDWELLTGSGLIGSSANPPVLLTAKAKNGLRPGVIAGSHEFASSSFNIDKLEVVAEVGAAGMLAPQFPSISSTDSRKVITLDMPLAVGPNSSDPVWDWTKTFSQTVSQTFSAHVFATGNDGTSGFFPPADRCNGTISGSVLNAVTSSGIADTVVTVSGGDLLTAEQRNTGANGLYSVSSTALHATGLCAGNYTVYAAPPLGYTDADSDGFPSTVHVALTADASGNDTSTQVYFRFYPAISSDFLTFGQGDWGAKPNPRTQNAGFLLQTYYIVPYGSAPLVIGGTKTVTMTGPTPVQNFLPQEGRPMPLDGNYVDPVTLPWHRRPHTRLGSLAGETLALKLNVDFSATSLTRSGLGSLYVKSGKFKNWTVNQVLALANSVLGGGPLPAGMKYDDVEDAEEMINQNYQGGRNRGHLSLTVVVP